MTGHHAPSPITCVDDVPGALEKINRRQFMEGSGRSFALLPFVIVLILLYFLDAPDRIALVLVAASLAWVPAMVVYYFYLHFTVTCPRCGNDFGDDEWCKWCGLPKHAPAGPASAISCVDDVPGSLEALKRRQLWDKWGTLVFFSPLVAVWLLAVHLDSAGVEIPGSLGKALLAGVIAWRVGGIYYAGRMAKVKCPRCGNDFGDGDHCKRCRLPLHPETKSEGFGFHSMA